MRSGLWSALRALRRAAGRYLPPAVQARLKHAVRWPRPRWGNLRRSAPFSPNYGEDRGTPIDRIYIETFLATHGDAIRGRALEVKDDTYVQRFGGERLVAADVVDIDAGNPHATVVADLGAEGRLPDERYDCFVFTQTLQLVPDAAAAIRNAWHTLRPGGTALLTVPAVSRFEPSINDLWRFTPAGLRVLLEHLLPEARIQVAGYGNLLTSVAFLQGLAAEELTGAEVGPYDPHFPVIVGARIDKRTQDSGTSQG